MWWMRYRLSSLRTVLVFLRRLSRSYLIQRALLVFIWVRVKLRLGLWWLWIRFVWWISSGHRAFPRLYWRGCWAAASLRRSIRYSFQEYAKSSSRSLGLSLWAFSEALETLHASKIQTRVCAYSLGSYKEDPPSLLSALSGCPHPSQRKTAYLQSFIYPFPLFSPPT